MTQVNSTKDKVFKIVQEFLKNPPVIIWGSGATIPYGLPGMDDLKQCLKNECSNMTQDANLEKELEKITDNKVQKIKKIIRDEMLQKDGDCLKKAINDQTYFKPIEKMIKKFYDAHPHRVDIVTTNYDCVLEYALSMLQYNFTDGFAGKTLAPFKEDSFGTKKCINLIKVHGSLNWFFDDNNKSFYLSKELDLKLKPAMVLPAKNTKYREAFQDPYRSLIQQSDNVIRNAKSFFVIGFGFNDEHLTPKIENKIKEGTPIVIITKKATDSCKKKLNSVNKYCLFEQDDNGSRVEFTNGTDEETVILNKDYWELCHFMEDIL